MCVTLILSLGVQRHIIIQSPAVHMDQEGPSNVIRGPPEVHMDQEEGIVEQPAEIPMIFRILYPWAVPRNTIRGSETPMGEEPRIVRGPPETPMEEKNMKTEQPAVIPMIFRILYPWAVPRNTIKETPMGEEPRNVRGPPETPMEEKNMKKKTEQPAEIPMIFRILYPWAVPRNTIKETPMGEEPRNVRGPPETPMEEKNMKTEQPAVIPMIFRILYPWAVPRNTIKETPMGEEPRNVRGPPETPMEEKNMKRTEQPVEETVSGTEHVPPEPISWFIFLTRPPVWFSLAVLMCFLIVKYILRQYHLARILGSFMMFQELIGMIYLLIDIWNRRGPIFENIILPIYINDGVWHQRVVTGLWSVWSKGCVALDNTVPPVLIAIVTEHRSECILGVITMLVVLLLIYLKPFYRLRRPTSSNITPPPSGALPPPSGALPPPSGALQPSSGALPPTSDTISPPSHALPPTSDTISPPSHALPPPSGALPPTSDAIPPPSGALPPPSGALPPPSGALPPPSGALPPPSGALPPPSGALPPPSGALPPPSGALPPPSRALPPPSGALPPTSDTISPPSGTLPPPSDTISPPSGALPPPSGALPPTSDTISPPSHALPPPSENAASAMEETAFPIPSVAPTRNNTRPWSDRILPTEYRPPAINSGLGPRSKTLTEHPSVARHRENEARAMKETAVPVSRVKPPRASFSARLSKRTKKLKSKMVSGHRKIFPRKSDIPPSDVIISPTTPTLTPLLPPTSLHLDVEMWGFPRSLCPLCLKDEGWGFPPSLIPLRRQLYFPPEGLWGFPELFTE
ncbi:uncharacterized protein LOC120941453 [Rana temporaria]|uniref:uncharacterized protein LOC120941453 n=1 Tax=Rana temporaria TaxID=8407 RepID=UPI001AACAB7C|nr:uncharacterized protein LOC120941453 [Rana temporaria]